MGVAVVYLTGMEVVRHPENSIPAQSAIRLSKALPSSVTANWSSGKRRADSRCAEAARLEDELGAPVPASGARRPLQRQAQHHEAEVAVLEAGARR